MIDRQNKTSILAGSGEAVSTHICRVSAAAAAEVIDPTDSSTTSSAFVSRLESSNFVIYWAAAVHHFAERFGSLLRDMTCVFSHGLQVV